MRPKKYQNSNQKMPPCAGNETDGDQAAPFLVKWNKLGCIHQISENKEILIIIMDC